jgi:hypothetical protein
MIRLVPLAILILILVALGRVSARVVGRMLARRPSRLRRAAATAYEWKRRGPQLYRRIKAVPAPNDNREAILRFLDTRDGVEAFVEPRTAVSPLSVVLVAGDGESVRFTLKDDLFLREIARARGLRVFDAAKTGYPDRMRRYRRDKPQPGGDAG